MTDQLAGLRGLRQRELPGVRLEQDALRGALREFPSALSQTNTTLRKTDELAERARPGAPEAAPVRARAGAGAAQDATVPAARPRRSSGTRSARSRATSSRPCATCATPAPTSAATPRLTRSFKVLNTLLQHARLQPARRHGALPVLERLGARTPARRSGRCRTPTGRSGAASCCVGCPTYSSLEQIVHRPTRSSACRRSCSTCPPESADLPQQPAGRPGPMIKQAPSIGRILAMVAFALSCFGILVFLWLSFGGSVPLQPKGYRVTAQFPEATQLAQEADVRISGVTVGKVVTTRAERRHRTDRRRARDRRALRAAAERHARDPAPEDAARRDLRGAVARRRGAGRQGRC